MSLDHPFEEPTTMLGLVHQFHVRLDPALVHQPPDQLGRAIAPIGDQARRGDVELFRRAVEHCFSRADFRPANGRRRQIEGAAPSADQPAIIRDKSRSCGKDAPQLTAAVSLQDLDIVGAFEGLRVLHPLLAHDAAHLIHRSEFPRPQPGCQSVEQDCHIVHPVTQKG